MKKVFISRDLKSDSFFRKKLEGAGWQVRGESLIRFEPVAFPWPQPADWIFFTSRKGVSFFFSGLPEGQREVDGCRLACLGPGTLDELRRHGYKVAFVGDGRPESVAATFGQMAAGQTVLFPRGERSLRSIQRAMPKGVRVRELVVYRNRPRGDIAPIEADIFVLTSPMNVEALLASGTAAADQVFVAIGQTTAAELDRQGVPNVRVAREPTEEGLAEAAML